MYTAIRQMQTAVDQIRNSVVNDQATLLCTSFSGATAAAVQILLEAFLIANACTIVSISYTQNTAGTTFTCFLTYNITV
jgi:hypothetical protein